MWQVILVVTAVIYGWGFAIAVLYEEWMYFIEEGLFSWLFFGWFIPVFRAIDWPLDLYRALVG